MGQTINATSAEYVVKTDIDMKLTHPTAKNATDLMADTGLTAALGKAFDKATGLPAGSTSVSSIVDAVRRQLSEGEAHSLSVTVQFKSLLMTKDKATALKDTVSKAKADFETALGDSLKTELALLGDSYAVEEITSKGAKMEKGDGTPVEEEESTSTEEEDEAAKPAKASNTVYSKSMNVFFM